MKSLLLVAGLLLGLNAHAAYKAEVLANWFTSGTTEGVDAQGNVCEVMMSTVFETNMLTLKMAKMDIHKTPRFNTFISNNLKAFKETDSSLYIVLKSTPTNSYSSAVTQTLNVTKTAKGTIVTLAEKGAGVFGKSTKATCILD